MKRGVIYLDKAQLIALQPLMMSADVPEILKQKFTVNAQVEIKIELNQEEVEIILDLLPAKLPSPELATVRKNLINFLN